MLAQTAVLLLLSTGTVLSNPLHSNLAYRSPSLTFPELSVDTHQIHKRDLLLKRDTNVTYVGNLTFPYGIASGDPYNNSVILWTMPRKLDLNGVFGGSAYPPICVRYYVSTSNTSFTNSSIVNTGTVVTTEDIEFSVKVEATGLQPYTQYYYYFESCAGGDLGNSTVGAFKTLPGENDMPEKISLAVFSCSNLPFGFFNAYGHAANRSTELDYVQHVGDYIYEYKNGDYGDGTAIDRVPQPNRECSSLQDYRDRYASYRTDPDLQNLHAGVAWQTVWDHEVGDQAYNAGTADSNDTIQGQVGDYQFSQRKANAVRAYFEWMPIRQVDTDDQLRIWRSFKVGSLFDMVMLDTRNYNRSITDLYYNTAEIAKDSGDANRSMTGQAQENWFFNELTASQNRGAHWKLIMQQIVFGLVNYTSVEPSYPADYDAWSGYRAERQQILSYIKDNNLSDIVILSGDSHASWVFDNVMEGDTTYNATTGEGALGVEFAGSAVSSPSSYGHLSDELYVSVASSLANHNQALQYAEGQLRGYFDLTVTPNSTTAQYWGFYDQLTRNSNATLMGTFAVDRGTNRLRRPLNNGQAVKFGAMQQNN